MTRWRLLQEDGVDDAYGLAADDALTGRVGRGLSLPILRLYTYRPCALVGRFQTIGHELRLERCSQRGMAVNRRPTGGGAIVMGANQLGIALMLPGGGSDVYAVARQLMVIFSAGICHALAALGIEAAFRGKNDIEVGGRKIAGLGIFRLQDGGLLFHASLLVGLDVPLMLDVLNTPYEKITDKEIATVAARTSTVRTECGRDITLDEVRTRVAEGYAATFGVTSEPGAVNREERETIDAVAQEKYRSAEWIYQDVALPDAIGSARQKTPAGLLDVRVTLAGTTVKAVMLGGDFFAAEGAVADLDEERLAAIASHGVDTIGVGLDAATEALFHRTRGKGARGPHDWSHHWRMVRAARRLYGPMKVNCHIIVGLGETDQELVHLIYQLKSEQIACHFFSFNPEPGTAMQEAPRAPIERLRRLQLVKYLIEHDGLPTSALHFDDLGRLERLGALEAAVSGAIANGEAFMTNGCPDRYGKMSCNRPYGSYRPGEPFRDYPFPPTYEDLETICDQMRLHEIRPGAPAG